MPNRKVDVPIKITLDSEDIKKLIKDENSSEKYGEKTLKRDKLLLDLMIHAYDEDASRNELVDTKNSQMIILVGAMLTLQSTLFTQLLVTQFLIKDFIPVCCKILLSIVIILSISFYVYSMYRFIDAYSFSDKFDSVPTPKLLLEQAQKNVSEFEAQAKWLGTFGETIEDNSKVIDDKIEKGKIGFIWLKRAGLSTLIFLILCLFFMFCYM